MPAAPLGGDGPLSGLAVPQQEVLWVCQRQPLAEEGAGAVLCEAAGRCCAQLSVVVVEAAAAHVVARAWWSTWRVRAQARAVPPIAVMRPVEVWSMVVSTQLCWWLLAANHPCVVQGRITQCSP